MEDNKIFVFLSHSHLDYEKVRKVRDLLEEEGFRPLMFFLKCLEKDEYKELTEKLITEEIDSRQRFVLCRSENTKESDWVKFEVQHIKETNRPYEIVDLDWPDEKINDAVKRFKRRSTVFLSYPRKLSELAIATNQRLKEHDFRTFFDRDDIEPGTDWASEIKDAIVNASKRGYVLALIGDNESNSDFQYQELLFAMNKHAHIIPVVTSENIPSKIRLLLMKIQYINVRDLQTSEAAEKIVKLLLEYDIDKYNK